MRKKSIIMLIMKKLLTFLCLIVLTAGNAAYSTDYDTLYDSAELFPTKLYNDIDPYEDEDSIRYAYSPYPLFRTSATLYFKDYAIEPGYYTIVPRKLKGKDYILFKQNGKVQYIIPVVKKEPTPVNFYEANIPKVKQTAGQKAVSKIRNTFYKISKDSMKIEPPKSLINVEVEVKYIVLVLYYGEDKYTAIFRRTPY